MSGSDRWPPGVPPEDVAPIMLDLLMLIAEAAVAGGLAEQLAQVAAKRAGPAGVLVLAALDKATRERSDPSDTTH